jgi:NitT/TauT family transport system substrate-binding protein
MPKIAWLGLLTLALWLGGCASPPGGAASAAGGTASGGANAAAASSAAVSDPSARPLERLVIALPVVTGVFVPHVLARDKGFFREEGFEVEFPVMRTNLVVTALSSGEADYNSMIGPSIPPILSGQPHRVIAGVVVKSTRQLMAVPEIQSMEQLRGKAIAVSTIGGGPYNSGLLAVEAFGMDPQRDVTWLALGGTAERLAAMQQGGAQASIFSGPDILRARSLGFHTILNLDQVAPLPESGLTTSLARIENDRDQVKRVLRALVRALQYVKADRDGSLPTFMDFLSASREEAEAFYDSVVWAFSDDGTVPERTLRYAIDAEKKQLNITEEVPFARVADFGPLYEVLAEMGITPAPDSAR